MKAALTAKMFFSGLKKKHIFILLQSSNCKTLASTSRQIQIRIALLNIVLMKYYEIYNRFTFCRETYYVRKTKRCAEQVTNFIVSPISVLSVKG